MRGEFISRRVFLARAALAFGGAASVGGGCALSDKKPRMRNVVYSLFDGGYWVNPAFRSIVADHGGVRLFTFLRNGEQLSYTFKGFEAELLSSIQSRAPIKDVIGTLMPRYGITETECLREVAASLAELSSAGVVFFGDSRKITIVETRYERTFQDHV